MCGISGFYHPSANFLAQGAIYQNILSQMNQSLKHRGPDGDGTYLASACGFAHTRLSIIDLANGSQPMSRTFSDWTYTIIYNGEIYNLPELRRRLSQNGVTLTTRSDTEVLLLCFYTFGPDFVSFVDGIFSFAIYDERHNSIYLYRDAFGVKPLFYLIKDQTLIFSSEPKGIFCFPGVKPAVDTNGLNELFGLGPARNPGSGIFHQMHEVLPGHYLTYSMYGLHDTCYFSLVSRPHEDSYLDTIEKTYFLVTDAIKRQMISDVPICTFLSGGVDSSVVSAVCQTELAKAGKQLSTYSFDFVENQKYFKASSFQPSQDRPYVDEMVDFLGSKHTYLTCSTQVQLDHLLDSVNAHDLPCMADIDASLLYFCSEVAKEHKVVLTGECADEIFGGYPWFHMESFLTCGTFPWAPSLEPRKELLSPDLLELLHMEEYVKESYETAVSQISILPKEDEIQANRRRISYLNIRYFMQTLLNRMDRTSMYSGLEARVPFADRALVQYVFNIPWDMKYKNHIVKNILRQSSRSLLPDDILFRQKSPYPKTYHPDYEKKLTAWLSDLLASADSPLKPLLSVDAVNHFLRAPKDYGKPWYGQLMAGPQMIAYLIQMDYFLRNYHVDLLI